MDNLAEVPLEVLAGERLQVGQGVGWDVSLPLEPALALLHEGPELAVLLHELDECLLQLQLVSGGRDLASGQREALLVLLRGGLLAHDHSLPNVGGEDNQVEILLDVVHDLLLEEGLGGVIHDLVAKLGLSNVLPDLLDPSAPGLLGPVLVNDLVALVLGRLTSRQHLDQLLDDLELSPEEGVLAAVHLVPVHPEQADVHPRHSLHQALETGSELKLLKHAGGYTAGGRAREADLTVDNDGGADSRAHQGREDSVIVLLQRGGGVTDRDP